MLSYDIYCCKGIVLISLDEFLAVFLTSACLVITDLGDNWHITFLYLLDSIKFVSYPLKFSTEYLRPHDQMHCQLWAIC